MEIGESAGSIKTERNDDEKSIPEGRANELPDRVFFRVKADRAVARVVHKITIGHVAGTESETKEKNTGNESEERGEGWEHRSADLELSVKAHAFRVRDGRLARKTGRGAIVTTGVE